MIIFLRRRLTKQKDSDRSSIIMLVTKRTKVVTGFNCNARCRFCYYGNRIKESNRPKKAIINDLKFARRHGIEDIDFSGGEPTTHPDLCELIASAKKIGFKNICIITNGLKLKEEYYRSLSDAGLNETLFSIQGGQEDTHDSSIGVKGAFLVIFHAIEIAKKISIKIRTNTVVHKYNYLELEQLIKQIAPFEPTQVNFITINDWHYAKNNATQLMCKYSEVSQYLKDACNMLKENNVKNINVRYIPFCMMLGYEQYVCNHGQVKYDPFEWLPHVRVRLETNINSLVYLAMLAYGLSFGKALFKAKKGDILDQVIVEAIRAYNYCKHKTCRDCRYDLICDGVEKSYANIFGLQELNTVPGEKIREPYYFRTHLHRI